MVKAIQWIIKTIFNIKEFGALKFIGIILGSIVAILVLLFVVMLIMNKIQEIIEQKEIERTKGSDLPIQWDTRKR